MKKSAAQKREWDRCPRPAAGSRAREKGYVLLTLLLVFALMAVVVTFGVIIPIKFEMQRDQEQEMIHRGVQYSRAIRAYYKKFGRYPTKLEDLDNTSNLRYLRKHYKDPLSCRNGKCQDFKLLHFGDPGVTLGGGFSIGGGTIPGATPAGGMNGSGASGAAFGGSSFGGSSFGGSGFGNSGSSAGFGGSGFGGSSSGVNSSGVFAQSSGGNSNSGFGAGSNSQTSSGQQGTNSTPGSDSTEPSSEGQGTGQGSGSSNGTQTIGGGPIVGVASISKLRTIREFNHKTRYNEWQFLYDPATDRGGLITTPNQPSLMGFGQTNLNGQPGSTNGTNGTNGSNGSSFGQSPFGQSGFGQSSGFGNSSSPGGPASPAQPPANPPQQQQ